MVNSSFIAADVGNARIKLGLYDHNATGEKGDCPYLPEPLLALPLAEEKTKENGEDARLSSYPFEQIEPWLADVSGSSLKWYIASVNRPAATQLIEWLREHRPADRVALLAVDDLPLTVRLPRPDMVGIDRLVDAVAVNHLRQPTKAAAIVDVGSAITVDLVSAEGVFLGGAILPGIAMSARALHHFTDLLPSVDMSDLGTPPPSVGIDTVSAIKSGLYWGAIGAVRQLIEMSHKAATIGRAPAEKDGRPQIFLTGGAGAAVAELLGPEACFVLNLTLSGTALAAVRLSK